MKQQLTNKIICLLISFVFFQVLGWGNTCFKDLTHFQPVEKKTVLVVDDNEDIRDFMEIMVEEMGYDVITASNGQQAIASFENNSPHMVIMDVMMPEMNGYDATVEIKKLSKNRFTPIIFHTAVSASEDLAKCLNCGGDDFISKPVLPEILEARLNSWSRLFDSREELRVTKKILQTERDRMIAIMNKTRETDLFESKGVRTLNLPLEETSGDVILSMDRPDGVRHMLLGDFTGHGLTASFGAPSTLDIFYNMTEKGQSMEEILQSLNAWNKNRLPADMFLACAAVEYNPLTKMTRIFNHGIPSVKIFSSAGEVLHNIAADEFMLGILPAKQFTTKSVDLGLRPGDRIIAFSDGPSETINVDEQMYGETRLERLFSEIIKNNTPLESVLDTLKTYAQGTPFSDDISIFELTAW
ncbi:MAG: SpoIIE family protein phosphatase [Bacteriovoracaceae bacterium]|nr:SpoIIE family protein phosphatase [Bacteriovoracaceae bacterium]